MIKILKQLFLLFIVSSGFCYSEQTNIIHKSYISYIQTAKPLSLKKMSEADEKDLADKAMSILIQLRQEYITTKLHSDDIIFKYQTGEDFPIASKHSFTDKEKERITKFLIAIYGVFKNLTKEHIGEIIKKSPLELVPLFLEIKTLLEFASSDPRDFGHGFFSEKSGTKTIVQITDESIQRIMTPAVLKHLLTASDDGVFRLSRITSAFFREFDGKNAQDLFKKTLDSMKRSCSDDSRVFMYIGR